MATEPINLPAPVEKPRTPHISKRVREACAAMVAGEVKTITDAAKLVGFTREHLSRELSKPHVAEHLRQKAARAVAIAAGRAAAVKIGLLDCDSSHVRNDASSWVLGVAGIRPAGDPQVNLNISLRAGFVIDLSEPGDAKPIIDVTPRVAEG